LPEPSQLGNLRWGKPSEWYLEAEGTDLRVVKAFIAKGVARYSVMRAMPITEPFEKWHIGVFDTAKKAIKAAEDYCEKHPECRKHGR
jgi:hypothetical protein